MKMVLSLLSIIMITASSSMATLQIDWISSGFYLGGTTPLLDPTGVSRPQSTIAQLIWTPDATISLANEGTTDFLTGNEVLLMSFSVNYSDRAAGQYAYWNSGDALFVDNGSGLPPSYQTGNIYARIFQSSAPSAFEEYYAGPVVAALPYYWDGSGAQPTPPVFNMNTGTTSLTGSPYDVALSPYQVQPVPEPGTMALFALGVATLAASRRRRKVQA